MKNDIYTKFMLTVIALTLSIICIQNLLKDEDMIQKVVICDLQGNCEN